MLSKSGSWERFSAVREGEGERSRTSLGFLPLSRAGQGKIFLTSIAHRHLYRPLRLAVRTRPSHGCNTGSIPVGVTIVHPIALAGSRGRRQASEAADQSPPGGAGGSLPAQARKLPHHKIGRCTHTTHGGVWCRGRTHIKAIKLMNVCVRRRTTRFSPSARNPTVRRH